jgi:hypothetical protein
MHEFSGARQDCKRERHSINLFAIPGFKQEILGQGGLLSPSKTSSETLSICQVPESLFENAADVLRDKVSDKFLDKVSARVGVVAKHTFNSLALFNLRC